MKTVTAMVADYAEAEALTRKLKRLGFKIDDIAIVGTEAGEAEMESCNGVFFQSIEEFFGVEAVTEVRGYYAAEGMIVSVFVEDEETERAAAAMSPHGSVRVYSHSTEKPVYEEFALREKEGGLGRTSLQ